MSEFELQNRVKKFLVYNRISNTEFAQIAFVNNKPGNLQTTCKINLYSLSCRAWNKPKDGIRVNA